MSTRCNPAGRVLRAHQPLASMLLSFLLTAAATAAEVQTVEAAAYAHPFEPSFSDSVKNWSDEKYDLFCGKRPAVYLNGWWKLIKLRDTQENPADDYGTQNGFAERGFDDGEWVSVFVPWNWNAGDEFRGVGWYRRTFTVPAEHRGRRLVLRFSHVLDEATVFINGRQIGRHKMAYYSEDRAAYGAFAFDITEAVELGAENTIAVRAYHNPAGRWHGGIWQPVQIDVMPRLFTEGIVVTPRPAEKKLDLRCRFDNGTGAEHTVDLAVELSGWESYRYQSPDPIAPCEIALGRTTIPAGIGEQSFTIDVPNPVEWTYERPNLYHVKLVGGGETIGQTRFGYRQFTCDGTTIRLNGKKLWIPGEQLEHGGYAKRCDLWPFNQDLNREEGGYGGSSFTNASINLTEWFERHRNVNLLLIRAHSDCWTEPMFDVADELGVLVYPELPHVENQTIPHDRGGGSVFDRFVKNGQLPDDVKGQYARRIYAHWNHPSIWAFSLGNELYGSQFSEYLCAAYDYLKHEVGIPVPLTQSGRYYAQRSDDPFTAKVDFFDDHFYSTWEALWSDIETRSAHLGAYIHGKLDRPWYNGECFGLFRCEHWEYFFKSLKPGLPEIPRKEYVALCQREGFSGQNAYYWPRVKDNLRLYGIRGFLREKDAGNPLRAEYYKRMVECQRRYNEHVVGFATHRVNPTRAECMDAFGLAMRRINSPLYACADAYFWHHPMAGEAWSTRVYTFNDTLSDAADLGTEVCVLDPQGKSIFSRLLSYEKIGQGEKRIEPVAWTIPGDAATGRYTLRLTLFHEGEKLLDNDYDLYILGPDAQRAAIDTGGRKVGLYVKPSDPLFAGTHYDSAATRELFDRLQIAYEPIADFDHLDRYEILVIGFNSFSPELRGAGDAIRRWIEAGGKLLCLEQTDYIGVLPFARQYQLVETRSANPDLIVPEHPIFEGLENVEWDTWDREDPNQPFTSDSPVIVHKHLAPLSESVLATSAYGGRFGMTVAEVRIGEGVALFSQAEAVRRYGRDAVATRYLENLLGYALETTWDESLTPNYAIPPIAGPEIADCRIDPIDADRAVFVDLRAAANRGFADDKGRDGEGGWFDEGKAQDLRLLPTGDQTFEGVSFRIIDPNANDGRGCVVLHSEGNVRYPKGNRPEAVELAVGQKVSRMVFLVAGAWTGEDGSTAAELEFHFEGGQCLYETETFALKAGVNFGNWWIGDGSMPGARLAWSVRDPRVDNKIGLWMVEWTNRQPQAQVRSVTFRSGHTMAIPALVAATGEAYRD